jgi:hypothetical protein
MESGDGWVVAKSGSTQLWEAISRPQRVQVVTSEAGREGVGKVGKGSESSELAHVGCWGAGRSCR